MQAFLLSGRCPSARMQHCVGGIEDTYLGLSCSCSRRISQPRLAAKHLTARVCISAKGYTIDFEIEHKKETRTVWNAVLVGETTVVIKLA